MNEYISKWQDSEIHRFDRERMSEINIDEIQTNFLATIGLPKDAAPLLSFDSEANLNSIEEIYQLTGNGNDKRIQIGFDGLGDTLCIDMNNENKIVACDHVNNFKPRFVNTSAIELFKFLTVMKEFGEYLISERGENAYMDCDFTDKEHLELTKKLEEIDSRAIESEAFWGEELDRLVTDRDYYRNEK